MQQGPVVMLPRKTTRQDYFLQKITHQGCYMCDSSHSSFIGFHVSPLSDEKKLIYFIIYPNGPSVHSAILKWSHGRTVKKLHGSGELTFFEAAFSKENMIFLSDLCWNKVRLKSWHSLAFRWTAKNNGMKN